MKNERLAKLRGKAKRTPKSTYTAMVARSLLEELLAERDQLKTALANMTRTFINGSHYETKNPYSRDVVEVAMRTIAKCDGKDDPDLYEIWSNAVPATTTE